MSKVEIISQNKKSKNDNRVKNNNRKKSIIFISKVTFSKIKLFRRHPHIINQRTNLQQKQFTIFQIRNRNFVFYPESSHHDTRAKIITHSAIYRTCVRLTEQIDAKFKVKKYFQPRPWLNYLKKVCHHGLYFSSLFSCVVDLLLGFFKSDFRIRQLIMT